MSHKLIIKLKSNRSKRAVKKSTKKVNNKPTETKVQQRQSWLSRMLDIKDTQWHDEEYDANKDW